MTKPTPAEYGQFYQGYINQVTEDNVLPLLETELTRTIAFFESIPAEKLDYAYAEGKWTIKELIVHLSDAERVMAYRALRVGRGDQTPLPGFDENVYVPNSYASERTVADSLAEFKAVRQASIALFRTFKAEAWASVGIASGHPISVRALAYIIIGHTRHHINIIKERYL